MVVALCRNMNRGNINYYLLLKKASIGHTKMHAFNLTNMDSVCLKPQRSSSVSRAAVLKFPGYCNSADVGLNPGHVILW